MQTKKATAKTEEANGVRKSMNNSSHEGMFMSLLHFLQSKFLHDEEQIMKSIRKSIFKKITRYKDYSQLKYTKQKKYESPIYVLVTILEISKLHIYEFFCDIQKPPFTDIQLHYMDTNIL